MICSKCDKDMLECECPDAAKRIRSLFTMKFLHIGPEQRKRYEARIKQLEEQQSHVE